MKASDMERIKGLFEKSTEQLLDKDNLIVDQEAYEYLKDNLSIVEEYIYEIMLKIKETETIDDAKDYFQLFDKPQLILARMAFSDDVKLSDKLSEFVYDFDRLDDPDTITYHYKRIKNGYF